MFDVETDKLLFFVWKLTFDANSNLNFTHPGILEVGLLKHILASSLQGDKCNQMKQLNLKGVGKEIFSIFEQLFLC